MSQNPAITSIEIADSLKVSRKTISARIKALKEKGIIERIGSDNNGRWQIK
ncbi:MAG: winged helix-turn-helix transcriptional regulator [Clostridiales Family XIII bacterium]|nr:winged helix-turn-helix transcriptional regulator [Clostridiales Family XIII bacterium]